MQTVLEKNIKLYSLTYQAHTDKPHVTITKDVKEFNIQIANHYDVTCGNIYLHSSVTEISSFQYTTKNTQ